MLLAVQIRQYIAKRGFCVANAVPGKFCPVAYLPCSLLCISYLLAACVELRDKVAADSYYQTSSGYLEV